MKGARNVQVTVVAGMVHVRRGRSEIAVPVRVVRTALELDASETGEAQEVTNWKRVGNRWVRVPAGKGGGS